MPRVLHVVLQLIRLEVPVKKRTLRLVAFPVWAIFRDLVVVAARRLRNQSRQQPPMAML